jgi:hypothetical protein
MVHDGGYFQPIVAIHRAISLSVTAFQARPLGRPTCSHPGRGGRARSGVREGAGSAEPQGASVTAEQNSPIQRNQAFQCLVTNRATRVATPPQRHRLPIPWRCKQRGARNDGQSRGSTDDSARRFGNVHLRQARRTDPQHSRLRADLGIGQRPQTTGSSRRSLRLVVLSARATTPENRPTHMPHCARAFAGSAPAAAGSRTG